MPHHTFISGSSLSVTVHHLIRVVVSLITAILVFNMITQGKSRFIRKYDPFHKVIVLLTYLPKLNSSEEIVFNHFVNYTLQGCYIAFFSYNFNKGYLKIVLYG